MMFYPIAIAITLKVISIFDYGCAEELSNYNRFRKY